MKILGFSAKKQGGKTTAMRCVLSEYPCVELSMAGLLKDIVRQCFIPPDWGYLELVLDEEKNLVLPCGKTIRQVLQVVGTDMFRGLWDNCWINAFLVQVAKYRSSGVRNIVIPDIRFPNEVEAVQALGGTVIRLQRAPFEGTDQHSSETALDATPLRKGGIHFYVAGPCLMEHSWMPSSGFDVTIDNRSMSIPDQNEAVLRLVRECGLLEA